ncbi:MULTISPECIES: hypothetical protein [unclassified Streptomyces]|uniref:hypothetical protein n=1 Tax=unclassified Streptomyces TaxID=2593676 RepID=UPI002E7A135A|nr:hypothetical protein [Streptomyces sp. JV184]MEE1742959.1 hypothetical protein [Streptomyces sp. JV184]
MRSVDGTDGPPAGEAGPHARTFRHHGPGPGGPQPPAARLRCPLTVLLARADRGYARFLAQRTEGQDDGADGGEDTQR